MGKLLVLYLCLGLLNLAVLAESTSPPTTKKRTTKEDFAPLDITPFSTVGDIDPKLVAFRAFAKFSTPQPEGLKSESISVSYSTGKAVVTHTVTGSTDAAVSAWKYRLEMSLVNGKWKLTWAGKQQKCRKDNKWTKGSC
ncbi:MAG: hypothetical protein RMK91_02780 [Pseudanabaenaceae cyanobacterium SKYGB_i_bin29]|nr:hypothetical protein [Pseudanabaenaceae cyanobacterium SKYG29]MDW8420769.1 hypothetical protein [Pseudanabaenaceae cyanobacterium SKYGB_i_bin29]